MSNLFEKIGSVIATIGVAIGGFFGYVPEPEIAYVPETVYVPQEEETLGADAVLPIAGMTYYLSGTGVSSNASSFTLTSLTVTQNGKKINDNELSETFYVTLEPGSRTRQEIAACTTVAQNGDGTATISGCTRGMAPITPYTASTSLQFAHAGGSIVIFSNPPQLYNQVAIKDNDETITGQWTFSTFPITPSSSPATATTTGTVELATGAEAASSTIEGDIAGSKLVLHTTISTSSAPSSGNVVVVTGDDGNIDPGFMPSEYSSTSIRVFTASGSWTKPTVSTFKGIILEMVGGGGGGGSNQSTTGEAAGGGGGGGYCREILSATALTATSSVYITIGTAGAGGNFDANGTAGGVSYFSSFASSTGGSGGTGTGFGSGGAGGTGIGCDVNGGGGGGGAGIYVNADAGIGGSGGSSSFGGGGVGSQNGTGGNGTGYGGGGAGGADTASGSVSGGSGTQGIVIITEYY